MGCKIWVSSTVGVQGLVVRSGLAMQKRVPYNQFPEKDYRTTSINKTTRQGKHTTRLVTPNGVGG